MYKNNQAVVLKNKRPRKKMKSEIEKPALSVDCPSCKTSIQWTEKFPDRPFCSVRCKNNDFIGWANEEQRIAGSASYDDIFSEGDLNDH